VNLEQNKHLVDALKTNQYHQKLQVMPSDDIPRHISHSSKYVFVAIQRRIVPLIGNGSATLCKSKMSK
jgi:hypothetical protein